MQRLSLTIGILLLPVRILVAQPTFPQLVADAFGSDQELINGIQFSNHYAQVDGHPYFLDESFREGSVYLADQAYENMRLRYNLYSQRVEMEYQYANGNKIQYMSVPELLDSFSLEGRAFVRMQLGDESPAYYLLISSEKNASYIGWKKDRSAAQSGSSRLYQFTPPKITYWLDLGQGVISSKKRKTFIQIFPEEIQKDIRILLKQRRYSFKNPTVDQAEAMVRAVLGFYETWKLP